MRSVLFVVNDLETFKPTQATAELVAACAERVQTWVTTADGFALTPGGISVGAQPAGPVTTPEGMQALRRAPFVELPVHQVGAVWVRTNPGRADRPAGPLLQLMLQMEDRGVLVRNAPSGLMRASSKLILGSLPPGTTPRTWASDHPERLSAFLDALGGDAVIKPALGTGGSGVVRLSPRSRDREKLLRQAVHGGPAMLQDYLPEAPAGDVRIHVVDGRILEIDGHACAVRRVPGAGEWRSNVSLGGLPESANLSAAQRALVDRVGPVLVRLGLWHVGLDVVGDKVVECNVFSPGGLRDASRFEGVDFVSQLVDRFLDGVG